MSLILEALRKSEAERRRGQAPDVLADMPTAQPVARRTLPAWLWLLPLGVVLVIVPWFLWDRQTPLPESNNPTPARQAETKREQPPEPVLPTAQRLTPQPRIAQPQDAGPVATTPLPTRIADTPGTASDRQAPLPSLPATVAPPRAIPVPATPRAAPARTLEPIATAQSAPTQADNTDTTRVALSDLTTAERKSLPPLKISMHLWNADPVLRFVILDGNRVVEGDRVGDAVVKAITSDGVVIDWHGRRIKLPIR